MHGVEGSRRRTGGYRWRLYRSGQEPDVMLESFMVPSWGEYRRQNTQRLTGRDSEVAAPAFDLAEGTPKERHYFPAESSR
jgi:Transmembrane secretion effector